jgi:hypothetical protein
MNPEEINNIVSTIPCDGHAMTAPEMVSNRINAKIRELSNANDFTRKAINI